jgi:hypothetical protein
MKDEWRELALNLLASIFGDGGQMAQQIGLGNKDALFALAIHKMHKKSTKWDRLLYHTKERMVHISDKIETYLDQQDLEDGDNYPYVAFLRELLELANTGDVK